METSGWGERRVTPKTGQRAQGRATEYSEAHRDAETSPTRQGLLGITASVCLSWSHECTSVPVDSLHVFNNVSGQVEHHKHVQGGRKERRLAQPQRRASIPYVGQ